MPDLTTENLEETSSAVSSATDESLMEAAFLASASGNEFEAPVVVQEEAPVVQQQKAEPATPSAPPASLTPEQLALLSTIPELEKKLAQRVDKVDGNYGEIKRLLESVKKAAATPEGAANAEDEWAELKNEYPELIGGISRGVSASVQRAIQHALTVMPQLSPEQVKEAIAAERQAEHGRTVANDLAILDKVHPDRLELIKTPEWDQWFQSLSEVRRAKLQTTFDLEYVADRLSEFKEFRAKKQAEKQKSQSRIESAVTPQGTRQTGRSTLSEADEMQRAFESAANS